MILSHKDNSSDWLACYCFFCCSLKTVVNSHHSQLARQTVSATMDLLIYQPQVFAVSPSLLNSFGNNLPYLRALSHVKVC